MHFYCKILSSQFTRFPRFFWTKRIVSANCFVLFLGCMGPNWCKLHHASWFWRKRRDEEIEECYHGPTISATAGGKAGQCTTNQPSPLYKISQEVKSTFQCHSTRFNKTFYFKMFLGQIKSMYLWIVLWLVFFPQLDYSKKSVYRLGNMATTD